MRAVFIAVLVAVALLLGGNLVHATRHAPPPRPAPTDMRAEAPAPDVVAALPPWSADKLQWTTLPIGQGAANVIQCPTVAKNAFLVDFGHSGADFSLDTAQLQAYLAGTSITTIIISHADTDHYALLPVVFPDPANDPILKDSLKNIVLGGKKACYASAGFPAWLAKLPATVKVSVVNDEKACAGNCPQPVTAQELCPGASANFQYEIVAANLGASKNSHSALVRFSYQMTSALLPGDFEVNSAIAKAIDGAGDKLKVDVNQVSHHGAARLANSPAWLKAVHAQAYVISSTRVDRRYKHPWCKFFNNALYPGNRLAWTADAHTVQCGKGDLPPPPLNQDWQKARVYQTTISAGADTSIYFIQVNLAADVTVAVTQAAAQWVDLVAGLDVRALNDDYCGACVMDIVEPSPGEYLMTVASEQLGFEESFGVVSAAVAVKPGSSAFVASNNFEGEFTFQNGAYQVPFVNPFVQVIGDDPAKPETWTLRIQATKRALRQLDQFVWVLPRADSVPDPLKRRLYFHNDVQMIGEMFAANLDIQMKDAFEAPQAQGTLASGVAGAASNSSFPTTGYFAPMLPLLSNLSPSTGKGVTAVSSFINMTVGGLYQPDKSVLFKLSLNDTLGAISADVGPFNVNVTDASIGVFMNPPGSSQAMNFSGSVNMSIGFPLIGTDVKLETTLSYPISAAAPLVVELAMPAAPSTYGFGFAGSFQFFGRWNPQNMGMLVLQVPGLVGYKTTTTTPLHIDASGLPVVLPDYFSGVTFNKTTSRFSFEGFAGSAAAAAGGKPVLNQTSYCFARLVDDILDSQSTVKRPSPHLDTRFNDFLGFHASSPRRSHAVPRWALASGADAGPCAGAGTTFPRIPLPNINWTEMAGGKACVEGLFGSATGVPVVVNSSGSIKDIVGGLPMRLALPPELLGNSTAVMPDFFGPGTNLTLQQPTIDIRKYPNVGNTATIYEGVLAANVTIDNISFAMFVALSTAPGNASMCQAPADDGYLLPQWFHPAATPTAAPVAASSALQAVRLFFFDVDYHTDVLQLHGAMYGVNGECPVGRTMAARLNLTLLLGAAGDSSRTNISVKARYNLCNSTEENPRWSLASAASLSHYGLFGAELSMANVNVVAKGWDSGNGTAWQVGIDGSATDVFGLDEVSVQAKATSIPGTPVDAMAALSLNTTLFHDPAMRISGNLSYYTDQSASGDVAVDLTTSFGSLTGEAHFTKQSPMGAHNDTYLWMVNGSVSNLSLSVLNVGEASLAIIAEPRVTNVTQNVSSDSANNTRSEYDILGMLDVKDASIQGLPFLSGSAHVQWNGTNNANVSLAFSYESSHVDLNGTLDLVLPLSGPNATAQGNVSMVIKTGTGDPVTFDGSVTWCGNPDQQCGDHEVNVSTGLVRFQDNVPYELAHGDRVHELGTTIVGLPYGFNPLQEMAALARRTTATKNGSVVIEAHTSNWQVGPFTLEKLVGVVKCEGPGCVGKVIGSATLGSAKASAAVAFSSTTGVQAIDFTLHESSDFLTLDAALHYNATSEGNKTGYTMTGTGDLIMNLPFSGGKPAPSGTANTLVNASNVQFTYTKPPQGNATIDASGTVSVGGVSATFAFTRVNYTCWNGYFSLGGVSVNITCGGVDFTLELHKKVQTDYFNLELDATLNVGGAVQVPGCDSTYSGKGTAALSNLPFKITPMAFTVAAAGCKNNGTTYYEAALQVQPGKASPYFAIPLGHTSLKVGNLAATVARTNKSKTLEVGLVGTLGGSAQDDTVLDMMLLFTGSNFTVAGVLRGPVSIGGLIMALAPGASITTEDPKGHLGAVDDALVMIGSDGSVTAALKITVFNLSCTAQLVINAGGGSGKAKITVYVGIHTNDVASLPAPLDSLGPLVQGADFVFAVTNTRITSTASPLNPATNVLAFLNDLQALPKSGDLSTLIARATAVCTDLTKATTLPQVSETGFGPGVLAAVIMGDNNPNFTALSDNIKGIPAFHDSMPKDAQLQLIATFSFDSKELDLLLRLKLSTQPVNRTDLRLAALMLLAKLSPTGVEMGFGMEMVLDTATQQFSFTGYLLVTSKGEVLIQLSAWSENMWANPFGVSKSIAVIFPVSFELGITVTGVPSTIGLAGGVSIVNQEAYASLLLRATEATAAFCADVKNFDLHKLVTAAICGGEVASGGDSCLGAVGDVLTSISLESGLFKFNTGAEVKALQGAGPCSTIEQGVFMELKQLSLFKAITVTEMCLAVTTGTSEVDALTYGGEGDFAVGASGPSVAAVVQMEPVTMGPLTISKSDIQSCKPVQLPPSSPCQVQPSTSAAGPLFSLYAAPAPTPTFAMSFDGGFTLLSQSVQACVEVDDKHFKAQVNMTLGDPTDPIKFNALLAAPFASTPPSFDFHVAADLITEQGIIHALTTAVTHILDEFTAVIHDGADKAKAGLQAAYNGLESAKGALDRAQQAVDSKFASLLNSVHSAQSWADNVKRNCQHHDDKCGFWHPIECLEAGGCWVEYGVAKAGLWAAEKALQAAQGIVDAGLQTAQLALSAAQGVVNAAQAAVDVAVAALDALNDLVAMALRALGSLIDIKIIGFDASLQAGTAAVDFHTSGHVLGQDFDVGFSATLDMSSITSVMTGIMKGILKSIFASKGLPAPSDSLAIAAFEGDVGANTTNTSETNGGFFLPSLSAPVNRTTSNTQKVSSPPFATAPGAIDNMCAAIQDMLSNMTHSAVTVDLSGLPWTCTLHGNETDTCLTAVMEQCFAPGHAAMLGRRRLYLHPFLTAANVREVHREGMGAAMKRCKSKSCDDIVLRVATTTHRVTLIGSDAGGVGALPNLNLHAAHDIKYSIDLSNNQYAGNVSADILGPGVVSLNLANNWLTDGFENVAFYGKNLTFLDLSGNPQLKSLFPNDCLGDHLGMADTLRAVALIGDDALVPDEPATCMKHSSPVITTNGLGVQLVRTRTAVEWQPWQDLCSACPAGLGPVNCTDHVCVNQTLLASLRANLTAEAQAELTASGLSNITLGADTLEILALDSFAGQVLATYRLRPVHAMQLPQAQHFAAYAAKVPGVAGAAVACPPGLVGSQCLFTCFTGWQRVSPIPPEAIDAGNITVRRLPKCHEPGVTATCTNDTVVKALQAIVSACPADTAATPGPACVPALQALPPLLGLPADCKTLATNTSLPPCVRAFAAQYAAAFCPAAAALRAAIVAPNGDIGAADAYGYHAGHDDAPLPPVTMPTTIHLEDPRGAARGASAFLTDLVQNGHLPARSARRANKIMRSTLGTWGDDAPLSQEALTLVHLLHKHVPLHLGHVAAEVVQRFLDHHDSGN